MFLFPILLSSSRICDESTVSSSHTEQRRGIAERDQPAEQTRLEQRSVQALPTT
jgi:hypothetical protein